MVRPPSSEKKEYTLPPVAAQALRQALQSELDALRRVMPQGVLTFTEMWYAWTPPPRSPAHALCFPEPDSPEALPEAPTATAAATAAG